jgi:hypothetical protein
MTRFKLSLIAALVAAAALVIGLRLTTTTVEDPVPSDPRQLRERLFRLLQPVRLVNCELKRFGEPNDGGYILCGNLLGDVQSAYSYGISGFDGWGCEVSTQLKVRTHQYDCFDTRLPKPCPSGDTEFHAECVAAKSFTESNRIFDSMERQFAKNGDSRKRLVVKMDVEGAEWDSLLEASDETLDQIDQLAIEMHYVENPQYVRVVERLKQRFHVAHLHFNNNSCWHAIYPFPAWAYEVLFVNKRLATLAPGEPPRRPAAVDAPNNPNAPDCQVAAPPGS